MRNTLRLAALVVGVRRASSMAALASKPQLTFVTGNAKKLEEVTAILNAGTPLPFAIGNRALDLPELQGEPEDIAREKCVLAAAAAGGAVMCEDTLLSVSYTHLTLPTILLV